MKKISLYMIAILGTISISSIVKVDAMSLNDALQSEDIILNFEDGGTIWCEYYDKKGFAPHPGYIKKQDYVYNGNTYYLPLNTISLFMNTSIGGGG